MTLEQPLEFGMLRVEFSFAETLGYIKKTQNLGVHK